MYFPDHSPFYPVFSYQTYCLYLYGCELWCLNSKSLNTLQVSINKVLRRIWRLSSRSHVPIVLSVAEIDFIQNIIHKHFNRFFFRCISSDIPIIRITSKDSSLLAYTFTGYNFHGSTHVKSFSSSAINIAEIVISVNIIWFFFTV